MLKELWTCVISVYVVFDILGFGHDVVNDKQEGSKHQTLGDTKNDFEGIGPSG